MSETKDIPVLEMIAWKSVSDELPDAGMEVLVCYSRHRSGERDVAIATYDDSDDDAGPWSIIGDRLRFSGTVMYWADIPAGPERADE